MDELVLKVSDNFRMKDSKGIQLETPNKYICYRNPQN